MANINVLTLEQLSSRICISIFYIQCMQLNILILRNKENNNSSISSLIYDLVSKNAESGRRERMKLFICFDTPTI